MSQADSKERATGPAPALIMMLLWKQYVWIQTKYIYRRDSWSVDMSFFSWTLIKRVIGKTSVCRSYPFPFIIHEWYGRHAKSTHVYSPTHWSFCVHFCRITKCLDMIKNSKKMTSQKLCDKSNQKWPLCPGSSSERRRKQENKEGRTFHIRSCFAQWKLFQLDLACAAISKRPLFFL